MSVLAVPGPRPAPGPSTPPPPSGPATPSKASGRALLDHLDASLIGALAITATALPEPADRMEACGQAILAFRLRMARAAVADLIAYTETPARPHLSSAAAVAGEPVQPRAGEPPLPGADFRLPRDVRPVRA